MEQSKFLFNVRRVIGIKGRIETNTYENDEGQSIKKTNVIADKVTFLSSAKTKDKEDEIE